MVYGVFVVADAYQNWVDSQEVQMEKKDRDRLRYGYFRALYQIIGLSMHGFALHFAHKTQNPFLNYFHPFFLQCSFFCFTLVKNTQ